LRVVIEATAEAACECAARQVSEVIRRRGERCVLGLAAGRTMVPVYAALARRLREEGLSLARVRAFGLDEYVGVSRDDPRSFARFLLEHVVGATDLPPASLRMPDARASDPFAEALRYEREIAEAGGIDVQLLGIGSNGHLGFNEPGSSLASRARVKALAPESAEPGAGAPIAAITLGLGTIRDARRCVLVALGEHKSTAVAAALEGPLTASVPASVLQLHPEAIAVLDAPAASRLARREEYLRVEALQRRLEEPSR
jgi:glucosamine-6-phosphate deaminase